MPESIWPRLEPLLPKVSKPARYIGGEGNLVKRAHAGPDQVKFLLTFPDAYEVGLPNLGLQILYEMLNERDETLAERAYAPWPDLEAAMRRESIPLFSVDNHFPAADFDVIAFTCPSELVFTNVLNLIDLAGFPVRSAHRGPDAPLVVAGGHAIFNPEPLAPFIDAFVIGDGEEVVFEVADAVREANMSSRVDRDALLRDLAMIPGVYVPALYDVSYLTDGTVGSVTPKSPEIPHVVEKREVSNLGDFPYPRNPLMPLTEVIHDRLSVEIFRGCTRGCRFCQAGMITRPVRERPAEQVRQMIDEGLAKTGYDDVSLLSLSSADYSGIGELACAVADKHSADRVSLSLPSLRVDAFTVDLAAQIQRVKRTGLTFAPEAGTWRMRRVVNKLITDEDLYAAVESAYSQGWKRTKLYFMIGLPTETDEDVLGIAELGKKVGEIGRSFHRGASTTVSVGGFVPKAHTPFQWVGQDRAVELARKISLLKRETRSRAVRFRWHDPEASVAEAILSRGDRRVADVVEIVWRMGGTFQEWSERFDIRLWTDAMAERGLSVDFYCHRDRRPDEVLPWDHISAGFFKDFLWDDYMSAVSGGVIEDCRWTPCYDCGVCMEHGVENLVASKTPPAGGSQGTGRPIPPAPAPRPVKVSLSTGRAR